MFLLPAATALAADGLIVAIHHELRQDVEHQAANEDMERGKALYKVGYLALMAWLRIIVLVLPLFFHSYTGTALPCHYVYVLWYSLTLFLTLAHMMTLTVMRPESLEALIPEPQGFLQDLHLFRRLWYTLLLSLLSNLAHFVIVNHVKSTAPQSSPLWRHGKPAQPFSLYFAIRARDPTVVQYNDEEPALVHAMNEFVIDMHARLQRTQHEWTKRLEDFSQRYNPRAMAIAAGNGAATGVGTTAAGGTASSTFHTAQAIHQSFQVLLQLFAYQDVLNNGQLDQIWAADGGRAVTFLVPQLLSFLLHGAASTTSKPLEEWILQHCRQNIAFAHHCFWFLRAWCLEVPLSLSRNNSEGQLSRHSSVNSLTMSANNNSKNNTGAAAGLVPFLDEPAQADTMGFGGRTNLQNVCGVGRDGSLAPMMKGPNDKFLPEERLVIEHLMLRVKENGEVAAQALMVGRQSDAAPSGSTSSAYYVDAQQSMDDGFHEDSMMLDRHASLPIHPQTGSVSQRHMETIGCARRYGFLPLSYAQQVRYSNNALTPFATDVFDETPRFWDSLIHLADSLFDVDRKRRKTHLRQALEALECELLPHNAIYVPLHHIPHRIWRIVPEESTPLGTKERVPCILTLEVVQSASDDRWRSIYNSNQIHGGGGGNGNRVYHRQGRHRLSFQTLFDRLPGRQPSLQSAYSQSIDSLDYSDDENALHPAPQHEMDEFDMIQEWRFKPRHPLRRVPFVNKVADSMKGGLKRVSETVRERFERDRTISEELQALTLGESFLPMGDRTDAETNAEVPDSGRPHQLDDNIFGQSAPAAAENSGGMKQVTSAGSLASMGMGQWGTPQTAQQPTVVEQPAGQRHATDMQSIRRRIDRGLASSSGINNSNNNGRCDHVLGWEHQEEHGQVNRPLLYGSGQDHGGGGDEDDLEVGVHDTDTDLTTSLHGEVPTHTSGPQSMSSSAQPRPPPVVFRESWEAKQDRIRQKSAYGKHPGWKLLPVLVKANDDLRQEQLASQLIYKMASILARERCPVWLCPYEILALTESGGIIEAIPDTISLDSLKRNDPNFTCLRHYFHTYYGENTTALANAKANFVESLAAYSMVCFLLQIKDRHNGNILLDSQGHVVHIDFGFFFLSSPGKNAGFESAPFKLTREFVDVLDGPHSHHFHVFRELCVRAFLALRKHCMEIILLVEMLKTGNEALKCFRGRPDEAIAQLRDRFRLDLNDRACREYVYSLVDNSIENWRTDWYDRYQRYFVGVL